jgi:hypothetical protein
MMAIITLPVELFPSISVIEIRLPAARNAKSNNDMHAQTHTHTHTYGLKICKPIILSYNSTDKNIGSI